MKTSSCKEKGRNLQKWVRDIILFSFPLSEDDVRSTSMGAGGVDVQLSQKAKDYFPYAIECKSRAKFNIYALMEQARSNAKNAEEPMLIIKQNRGNPLVVLDAEHFFALISEK